MGMFDNIFGSTPHTTEALVPTPTSVEQLPAAPLDMVPDIAIASDAAFDAIIEGVLGREGGYVNNPNDSGGETIWGITFSTARAFGYTGSMRNMTQNQAKNIYRSRYWVQTKIYLVYNIDKPIGLRLLDIAINAGPGRAGKFLQRPLNVLGDQGKYFDHLTVDGAIGNMTLDAMVEFIKVRGSEACTVLLKMIIAQQSVYYIECAENRETNEDFEWGWQKNRAFASTN